ncbi:hypothetical protein SLH49_18450 [Cognatiyoonia sp. IB215446]|uniref:hypothetical protein n=1 Tax=Cognatiyoonia sp. IB215446 TaxID=3097355 RepID=UPI002A11E943|nr:hypothetical protein [Cognatiyoonia sp. IB215446]MDX8349974.1 hypothetical protein [Cognatiyoonia sp. IB215446]
MTITPIGYLFFGSIAFGITLMVGVSRRWSKDGKPAGIVANLFFGLVLVCISTLFFMLSFFGAKAVYEMVTFPKYEATIISFESEWEEFTRTDSDGRSYTEDVLMHTPMLQFTDETGRIITQEGNIRSGAEPVIGDTVTVGYRRGRGLQVISLASIGLYTALFVMLLILGFILTKVLFFVLGRKSKGLDAFGSFLLVYIVIGGSMLFMLAAMTYGVFSYFQPGSDMPLWVMLVCAFFTLTLVLAFAGMFVATKNAKRKRSTS